MPVDLSDHLAENRHIFSIFILNPNLSVGENLEELILIALASDENEYSDRIVKFPLHFNLIKKNFSVKFNKLRENKERK